MTPIDIVEVLTAATPIVASVANYATKRSECNKEIERKENVTNHNINITINNNFYTNSDKEAMVAASKINGQVVGAIASNEHRYII